MKLRKSLIALSLASAMSSGCLFPKQPPNPYQGLIDEQQKTRQALVSGFERTREHCSDETKRSISEFEITKKECATASEEAHRNAQECKDANQRTQAQHDKTMVMCENMTKSCTVSNERADLCEDFGITGGTESHYFIFLQSHKDPVTNRIPPESARSLLLMFRVLQKLVAEEGVNTVLLEGVLDSQSFGKTKEERKDYLESKRNFEACAKEVMARYREKSGPPKQAEAEDICLMHEFVVGNDYSFMTLLLASNPGLAVTGFEKDTQSEREMVKDLETLGALWLKLEKTGNTAQTPKGQNAPSAPANLHVLDFEAIRRLLVLYAEPSQDKGQPATGQDKAPPQEQGDENYRFLFQRVRPRSPDEYLALKSALRKLSISSEERELLDRYLEFSTTRGDFILNARSSQAVDAALHSHGKPVVVIGSAHAGSLIKHIRGLPFSERPTFHFLDYNCPKAESLVTSPKRMLEIVDSILGKK